MDSICDESRGKCLPAAARHQAHAGNLERITGQGRTWDLDLLEELHKTIQQTAMCGLGQTAPNPVLSTLEVFRSEYEFTYFYEKHGAKAGACRASDLALPQRMSGQ